VTTELPAKSDEVTGSSTTYRFHVQTKQLQLPIRLWEPAIGARTGSYGARATFPALPAGLMPRELRAPIRYTIDFTRGNEIVWELANVRSVTTFDPRLLEDSTGTMRVTAWASGLHVSDRLGDEVAFALRSGARAYESPLGPPASRGKDCSVVDGRGTLHRLSPCGLTDGDFARAFSPSICTDGSRCVEPSHEAAIIDLGRAAPLDLIVVRGCDAPCRVDTSVDLRSWRSAVVAQSDRAAFSLAPRPARYVRVSSASVDALTEVSAWSGMPRLPDASLLVSPATFRGRTASGAPAPGFAKPAGRSLWWVIIAAALIGALIIGATVSSIARRRRVVP
jgi:hypothetical protein